MKPASNVIENLDLQKLNVGIREVIEIDEWLWQNPVNYARYSQNRDQAVKRIEFMKRWLDLSTSEQTANLEAVATNFLAQLFDYTKFGLPANENDAYRLVQSFDNPLVVALNLGKLQIAEQLITMGADYPAQSVLQYALINKNMAFLDLLLSSVAQKNSLTQFDRILVDWLKYNLHQHKNPCELLDASAMTLIIDRLRPASVPEVVIFAVTLPYDIISAPFDIIRALVSHPKMTLFDYSATVNKIDFAILDYAKYASNASLISILKTPAIKMYVETMRIKTKLTFDEITPTVGITQRDVSDYILNHARRLNNTPENIAIIQDYIDVLKNPDSSLHLFLRGYAMNRLRTALIKDLESISQTPNNPSSSSSTTKPISYLKVSSNKPMGEPDAAWRAATKEMEDIANRSLDRFL